MTRALDTTGAILVVDDEDSGRFVKVQTLKRAGFRVYEAATGRDALATAGSHRLDLVVLDVNLPDISGFEVSSRLRAAYTGMPSLQILQVSNTAVTPEDRVRGLEMGADMYLIEPVEANVLVATVRALLRVRRAEAALADALEGERLAREAAEEASRLKDEFIATLSHELRTPLNALMGWLWQLRHSKLSDAARNRAFDSLERNARLQAQLINDLLDISRISKGKLQLEVRLVDMATVIDGAVESIREAVALKQIDLQVQADQLFVAGDQSRLHQVVGNLLTNAVQFTPAHGAIRVTLSAEGDQAVARVQDTGAGIDQAFLPYVFDQFRQGEGGLSRKHGGLGLGLAVVKQLIDLHGGIIHVTSGGVGQGATFTVQLPLESVDESDATELSAGPLLAGLNVLILGPEAVVDELKTVAESSGAHVVRATSQAEAAVGLEAGAVDLVIHHASAGDIDLSVLLRSAAEKGHAIPELPVTIAHAGSQPAALIRSAFRLLQQSASAHARKA